jgi:hypothetical protein
MRTMLSSPAKNATKSKPRSQRPFTWTMKPTISSFHAAPVAPQFQLEVGPVNDQYEREADAVADAVVSNGEIDDVSLGASGVQRACSSCAAEEELQRKPSDGGGASTPAVSAPTTARIAQARTSGGNPLGATDRNFFESRIGANFGGVRLHHDANANGLSRQLGARAFTVGRDIFFGTGQFNLNAESGRHLIAHELTHTIQQSGVTEPKPNE